MNYTSTLEKTRLSGHPLSNLDCFMSGHHSRRSVWEIVAKNQELCRRSRDLLRWKPWVSSSIFCHLYFSHMPPHCPATSTLFWPTHGTSRRHTHTHPNVARTVRRLPHLASHSTTTRHMSRAYERHSSLALTLVCVTPQRPSKLARAHHRLTSDDLITTKCSTSPLGLRANHHQSQCSVNDFRSSVDQPRTTSPLTRIPID